MKSSMSADRLAAFAKGLRHLPTLNCICPLIGRKHISLDDDCRPPHADHIQGFTV